MTAADDKSSESPDKKPCPSCGGSGHLGLFHGESRFMISWEECFECNGTGYIEADDDKSETPAESSPE